MGLWSIIIHNLESTGIILESNGAQDVEWTALESIWIKFRKSCGWRLKIIPSGKLT